VRSELEAICLRLDDCRTANDKRIRLQKALRNIGSAKIGVEYRGLGENKGEVRIYREAVDAIKGTSLANLALKINKALGREAATPGRSEKSRFIVIDEDSFLDFLLGGHLIAARGITRGQLRRT
jgi:hypothetical protein